MSVPLHVHCCAWQLLIRNYDDDDDDADNDDDDDDDDDDDVVDYDN